MTRTTVIGPVSNVASFLTDTLVDDDSNLNFSHTVNTQVLGPTVRLSLTPASIAEAAASATLTATLDRVAPQPVTVNLGYVGSALRGTDFNGATSIVIPANTLSASITLSSIQDALDETNETSTVSISSVVNGLAGSPSSATLTIRR